MVVGAMVGVGVVESRVASPMNSRRDSDEFDVPDIVERDKECWE